METRREQCTHDLRTKLSLQALHSEDVTQQQNQEYAGLHRHLTGFVQDTQQYRKMFEDSRAAQSAAGREIDRLRRREAELQREVRRYMTEQNLRFFFEKDPDKPGVSRIQDKKRQQFVRELRSEVMRMKASVVPPNLTRDLEAKIESPKTGEPEFSKRFAVNTGLSEQLGCSSTSISIRGVYVDESVGTSTSSVSRIREPAITHLPHAGVTLSCFDRENTQCQKQQQNWLQLRVRHQRAFRQLQWQYPIVVFRRFLFHLKC